MENLIWLLVLGGLFFLMHKMGLGCCGGGHSHGKGHEGHHGETKDNGKLSEGREKTESPEKSCH